MTGDSFEQTFCEYNGNIFKKYIKEELGVTFSKFLTIITFVFHITFVFYNVFYNTYTCSVNVGT